MSEASPLAGLLADWRSRFETQLAARLADRDAATARLHEGMRYSALGGGKRLRPILVYCTGTALSAPADLLDDAAAAVEMLHVYSLVHDDLPAMDDDDLRRGRPTCHKAFDEGTAVLVGDALQALAFEVLAGNDASLLPAAARLQQIQVLSPDVVNVSIADVDCASDTPIGFGETKSGVIDAALPANYCHGGARGSDYNTVRYSFEGQAGDIVSIDLTSTTASPEILDTYLFLLDPNRVVIAQNDDVVPNQNRNSRLSSILLTQSGTHYIEATTWHPTVDATGTYDLVLHCGAYTAGTSCSVDADGDGLVRVADGLLLMRRFAGASNLSLTGGMAFGSCATRTTGAAIAAFADPQTLATSSLPALDIDGDGKVLATTDGLLLVRALLGLTGDAVVSGALAPTATRSTWPAIRSYLNGQCGLALLP